MKAIFCALLSLSSLEYYNAYTFQINPTSRRICTGHPIGHQKTNSVFPILIRNCSARLKQPPKTLNSLSTTIDDGLTSDDIAGGKLSLTKKKEDGLGKIGSTATKVGMILFLASMMLSLPITLIPISILRRMRLISNTQREKFSLRIGSFCARWLMRLIPFARVTTISPEYKSEDDDKPCIWVCNHASMLDVFFMLATNKKLRDNARPLKIVYWKDLEDNPATRILFTMCGFIPVEMKANKPGEANEYNPSSVKSMFRSVKKAFDEGFDIGILPEGQLNPNPEAGLLPLFGGAYTLSKMSKRPIRMMALSGTHKLWHPDDSIGMSPTSRDVKVRCYPCGQKIESSDQFVATFTEVVGTFGATGEDLPKSDLDQWLNGQKWKAKQSED